MAIYNYCPNSDIFSGLMLPENRRDLITVLHFQDERVAPSWKPIVLQRVRTERRRSDFPSLVDFSEIPVVSPVAWDSLRGVLSLCCEPLEVRDEAGNEYVALHATATVACLDRAASEYTRNRATGRINNITRHVFDDGLLLAAPAMFKLPAEDGRGLYFGDKVADRILSCGLVGLFLNAAYEPAE